MPPKLDAEADRLLAMVFASSRAPGRIFEAGFLALLVFVVSAEYAQVQAGAFEVPFLDQYAWSPTNATGTESGLFGFRSLAHSALYAGMFAGSIVWSWLSDRFGRRPVVLWCLGLNVAGSIIVQLVASNPWGYALAHAGVGTALGGIVPVTYTLLAETTSPTRRRTLLLVFKACFPLGSMYAAAVASAALSSSVAWSSGTWRILQLAITLPQVASWVIFARFAPESPKWRLRQGEKASAVFADFLPRTPCWRRWPQRCGGGPETRDGSFANSGTVSMRTATDEANDSLFIRDATAPVTTEVVNVNISASRSTAGLAQADVLPRGSFAALCRRRFRKGFILFLAVRIVLTASNIAVMLMVPAMSIFQGGGKFEVVLFGSVCRIVGTCVPIWALRYCTAQSLLASAAFGSALCLAAATSSAMGLAEFAFISHYGLNAAMFSVSQLWCVTFFPTDIRTVAVGAGMAAQRAASVLVALVVSDPAYTHAALFTMAALSAITVPCGYFLPQFPGADTQRRRQRSSADEEGCGAADGDGGARTL